MEKCPIIGILCVDIPDRLQKKFGEKYSSYISASYVKFLESAGARIVPIWIGKTYAYYVKILSEINGLLMPGGAVWFDDTYGDEGKYAQSGKMIYHIAVEMNIMGIYFPIWGTCLGYELMLFISSGEFDPRQECLAVNDSLPLQFTPDYKISKMFKNVPEDIFDILINESVAYNFHRMCITREVLDIFGLSREWLVTSVNKDRNGLEYISTIEHKKFPFYGVQFHPEKPPYEYSPNENICHSTNAIKVSQYFANFFVSQTKNNYNQFRNRHVENYHLIYNFPVTFTGLVGSRWLIYLFEENIDYPVMQQKNNDTKKRKRFSNYF